MPELEEHFKLFTSGTETILTHHPIAKGALEGTWDVKPVEGVYPNGGAVQQDIAYRINSEDKNVEILDVQNTRFDLLGGVARVEVTGGNFEDPQLQVVFPLGDLAYVVPNTPSVIRISIQFEFEGRPVLKDDDFQWSIDLGQVLMHAVNFGSGVSIRSQYIRQYVSSFWGFAKGTRSPKVILRVRPFTVVDPKETLFGKFKPFLEWFSVFTAPKFGEHAARPCNPLPYGLNIARKTFRQRHDVEEEDFVLL